MDALYAFMRLSDDLADEPGEVVVKRAALAAWRKGLAAALDGHFSHPIHPALVDTIQRYSIPPRYLFEAIDGVESDLEPVTFATFAEPLPLLLPGGVHGGARMRAHLGIAGLRDLRGCR